MGKHTAKNRAELELKDALARAAELEGEVNAGRAERAEYARVIRERDEARRQLADDREALLANARLIAAAPQLLEACVGVLGNSTHRGQCIFCGARIDEEHAECCPTIPLRKSIRAAREGKP